MIQAVQDQALRYFSVIDPHFPIDDYVFDFGFTPDGPVLIEINPYGLSDPCLFGKYSLIDGFRA
ncbi:hypothetical protein FRUB_10012 [Fimbriiglobus ruber]|uniref:ATP-grasp domain-containing protein n=1 Tax=Fimbriiglobus ruber TaxID=1908690 RepID=A0A225D0N9_9BACT|nr:hypothetical protein FRUB_10012 [Fimbriiglobus ruber]